MIPQAAGVEQGLIVRNRHSEAGFSDTYADTSPVDTATSATIYKTPSARGIESVAFVTSRGLECAEATGRLRWRDCGNRDRGMATSL
jgi:hypothetical protein